MAGNSTQIRRDIARWRETGLIDPATAERLLHDVEQTARRGFSFGTVLALLAAALFCAAVLIFVAANWEMIDRPVRVGMIFFAILAGYVGGALLKLRRHEAFGEAAWLVAAAAFGAGIALVAQMYHLSGDERQAVLVWMTGTALAAAALRSAPLTAGAVLLATVWMAMAEGVFQPHEPFPMTYPLVAGGLWLLAVWTRSAAARHLVLLSLILYVALFYGRTDEIIVLVFLAGVSALLFAVAAVRPDATERLTGLGPGLAVDGFLGFLAGMGLLQFALSDHAAFVAVAALVFAGVVAALVMAGRDNRMLRWLAYAAFGSELCYIYVEMVGTMLGTAGFFLAAGLILAGLAYFILRMERRLSTTATAVAGGA